MRASRWQRLSASFPCAGAQAAQARALAPCRWGSSSGLLGPSGCASAVAPLLRRMLARWAVSSPPLAPPLPLTPHQTPAAPPLPSPPPPLAQRWMPPATRAAASPRGTRYAAPPGPPRPTLPSANLPPAPPCHPPPATNRLPVTTVRDASLHDARCCRLSLTHDT